MVEEATRKMLTSSAKKMTMFGCSVSESAVPAIDVQINTQHKAVARPVVQTINTRNLSMSLLITAVLATPREGVASTARALEPPCAPAMATTTFVYLCYVLICTSIAGTADSETEQPNIVIFLADDVSTMRDSKHVFLHLCCYHVCVSHKPCSSSSFSAAGLG